MYVGEDAMEHFLEELEEEEERIRGDLQHPAEMVITPEEQQEFLQAAECWICNKPLDMDPKDYRVQDHDHITGEYRGAAHRV